MKATRRIVLLAFLLTLPTLIHHGQSPEDKAPTDDAKSAWATDSKLRWEDRRWLADQLLASLGSELLRPDPKWAQQRPKLHGEQSGICRILNHRAVQEPIKGVRGNGAYYSFTSRSNSYDDVPQLGLEQWRFSTGFYGASTGMVAQIDAESVEVVSMESLPLEFTAADKYAQTADYEDLRKLRQQFGRPAAAVGGVYAMRAVMWGECDVLAAFEVLDKDAIGLTIGWRILHVYPTPEQG